MYAEIILFEMINQNLNYISSRPLTERKFSILSKLNTPLMVPSKRLDCFRTRRY